MQDTNNLTARVQFACGCGFRAVAENIGDSSEARAALEHALNQNHSLTITGELRIQKQESAGRPVWRPVSEHV